MVQTHSSPEDAERLKGIIDEVLETVFSQAADAIEKKTGADVSKIRYADRIKIDLARHGFDLCRKYNAASGLSRVLDISNTMVPLAVRLFGEERTLDRLPPHLKTEQVAGLLEQAGATALSGLIRKGQAPA